jgi:hypothetical protein
LSRIVEAESLVKSSVFFAVQLKTKKGGMNLSCIAQKTF